MNFILNVSITPTFSWGTLHINTHVPKCILYSISYDVLWYSISDALYYSVIRQKIYLISTTSAMRLVYLRQSLLPWAQLSYSRLCRDAMYPQRKSMKKKKGIQLLQLKVSSEHGVHKAWVRCTNILYKAQVIKNVGYGLWKGLFLSRLLRLDELGWNNTLVLF